MSIEPPKKGKPIRAREVEEMFASAVETTNNLTSEELQRSCFGPHSFDPISSYDAGIAPGTIPDPRRGGIVTGYGYAELNGASPQTIDATVTPDDTGTNTNSWELITDLELKNQTNGGYYLLPGKIVAYFSLRIPSWHAADDEDIDGHFGLESKWWALFAASYTINSGTETVVRETIGGCKPDVQGVSGHNGVWPESYLYRDWTQEQNVSFWYVIDTSEVAVDANGRFTLNNLRIRAARAQGNGDAFAATDGFVVKNGYHAFFSLKA